MSNLDDLKFRRLREIALRSPVDFAKWCSTKDENASEQPVKPFPVKEKPHLGILLNYMLVGDILFIPKSRQVMMTWTVCIYVLWLSKRYDYRLSFVQSKKEEDAGVLVFSGGKTQNWDTARISFLESHLPEWLRDDVQASSKPSRLVFPNGSIIEGIPEGGDMIRSKTPSLVFSDEAAFQPEFSDAYTAMLPLVKHGGQLIALSSANPGFFGEVAGRGVEFAEVGQVNG